MSWSHAHLPFPIDYLHEAVLTITDNSKTITATNTDRSVSGEERQQDHATATATAMLNGRDLLTMPPISTAARLLDLVMGHDPINDDFYTRTCAEDRLRRPRSSTSTKANASRASKTSPTALAFFPI